MDPKEKNLEQTEEKKEEEKKEEKPSLGKALSFVSKLRNVVKKEGN